MSFLPLFPSFDYLPLFLSSLWLFLQTVLIFFYCPIGSDEVLLKIILESLIHVFGLNRMEINLLS